MSKFPNNLLIIVAALASPSAFSEVYQCVVDGKSVFQQTPCEVVEALPTTCDSNHDYSKDVGPVDTSFEDKYCFYLQLDKASANEKTQLMQAYQLKKTEAQAAYDREISSNKLQEKVEVSTGYAKELSNYSQDTTNLSAPIQGYIE